MKIIFNVCQNPKMEIMGKNRLSPFKNVLWQHTLMGSLGILYERLDIVDAAYSFLCYEFTWQEGVTFDEFIFLSGVFFIFYTRLLSSSTYFGR